MSSENIFLINYRHNIQWCIASEKSPCNIQIRYQTIELEDENPILFDKEIIPIEKYVLQGEFETHRSHNKINLFNIFLNRVKLKLMRLDNNDEINVEISNIYHPHIEDTFNESLIYIQPQSIIPVSIGQDIQAKTELIDPLLLKDI
ncbi:unnamed protein product [Adineta steineri]|uniref:Uncharacterized protein n=1 Tax=Adineta steineri TaxID=433720 RepID=A0A813Y8L2_9BILA|nr:unnamed protein product [Adineta steineri]